MEQKLTKTYHMVFDTVSGERVFSVTHVTDSDEKLTDEECIAKFKRHPMYGEIAERLKLADTSSLIVKEMDSEDEHIVSGNLGMFKWDVKKKGVAKYTDSEIEDFRDRALLKKAAAKKTIADLESEMLKPAPDKTEVKRLKSKLGDIHKTHKYDFSRKKLNDLSK